MPSVLPISVLVPRIVNFVREPLKSDFVDKNLTKQSARNQGGVVCLKVRWPWWRHCWGVLPLRC
ncbi:hypothetical protein J8273_5113 [Carpediemonas membranifera]|uniref:Uncharacterized protein n=1 Tax=Carpediemonas membranifera TaxID=201153 RepID=A0A8J6B195_9EUKA|nr:hypothetical protein J8273_5113 [Carpediemonas membranifera]|eukprot:KAG9392134.1 hypothetical protein J8273_5113 [Carpediemonas membranifera]